MLKGITKECVVASEGETESKREGGGEAVLAEKLGKVTVCG